ncbi:hypothetical protein MK489_01595 [Myxococcota bacterium]|nr:hypothetical protein [Myxococcota bacterium]
MRAHGRLAVVDLETTGLPAGNSSEILEIGAVLLGPGEPVATVETLVCPRGFIPRSVRRLTGLAEADVAEAPSIDVVAPRLANLLSGRILIAHNADFERHFLSRFVASDLGNATYLDTQDLLCITHPDAPDMRLETFTRDLLGTQERHRALSDALDATRVICEAAAGARRGEARYATARNALETYSPRSPWIPLLETGAFPSSPDESIPYVKVPASSESPVPFDADAIAEVLADEARGRRHFPGYRVREAQIEMAREFAEALDRGESLLLEGGTGVGKSLAYLAAAIPFAVERADGGVREPIAISTRTKLLQDQLMVKDIPAAAAMLGYPNLQALSMKGRANYACARRLGVVLAEGRETGIFEEDRLAYAALTACAKTRPHGEVGTLAGGLLFRFPLLRDLLRRSVAARADQCTREQCAQERSCPLGRRRRALSGAHLVVANHDLLLRWPSDYPNFTTAIVDEAHELAGVADEVYAAEVRPEELLERIDDLFGRSEGRAGAQRGVSEESRGLLPAADLRNVKNDVARQRRDLQQDLIELGRSLARHASEFGEVQLPDPPGERFPAEGSLARTAAERLEQIAHTASIIDVPDEEIAESVERAIGDLRAGAADLRGAFENREDAVAAFERLRPPFDNWRLVVRFVSPADSFHEQFAQSLETLACVSASLFVGDEPFASLGELEIENRANMPVRRVAVASPFPYLDHMRVVALQSQGDLVEETSDVLAELARALGGRTLGLFTSLKRMNQVAERLSDLVRDEGLEVLAPRRAQDDPAALVERFRRTGGGSILLGARTFWQGVDIPGPALQAVVIEKLPFEVPTELRRRRVRRLETDGEPAFERYTLGKMLLNLKQMVGRLIRTEDDRGVVVVVEGRTDKRYFSRLSDALPEACHVVEIRRDELAEYLEELELPQAESSDR